MREVIDRNKFVIILGLILSVIFAVIIILSQNKNTSLTLTPAKKGENFKIESKDYEKPNPKNNTAFTNKAGESSKETTNPKIENASPKIIKPIDRIDEVIANMEPVIIEFNDEDGFVPISSTAIQDQKLTWVNKTNRVIEIEQTVDRYDNLPEVIEIDPGQSYTIKLTEYKNWGYRELKNRRVGTIFVYKKKTNQN